MGTPNWVNRAIVTGDNLDIMRKMNSESVDLIYLDPPFNSNRNYEAPVGSEAAGAAFKDTWTLSDLDKAWMGLIADTEPALYRVVETAGLAHGKGMQSYLCMMAVRLTEMRRVLRDTGSIYLHCDPTASHYLKTLMDVVFGSQNFNAEIVWSHQGSWIQPDGNYPRRHDTVLFYGKTAQTTFNIEYDGEYESQMNYKRWKKFFVGDTIYGKKMPDHDKRFQLYLNKFNKKHGRYPEKDDVVLKALGSRLGDVQYIKVVDPKSKESTHYPTQKPLALLERIIRASSNEDGIVLDPFCGCATACVAAEKLNRQWIRYRPVRKGFRTRC